MYKISIIVPVYNVAKYLGEALDSILRQSIGAENLQVIMVDDGSTDESIQIMKKYEDEYNNFIGIYLNEKSGGAGKPRNIGIQRAQAPYIMFLDSDDIYDDFACEKMYNAIVNKKVDIVTANYKYMDEDGVVWKNEVFNTNEFKNFKFGTRSFRDSFFIWNSAVWNKIFSRDLIVNNNIEFLDGVPAEDAYFTYATLLKTDHVYYISDTIYYYRRRNGTGTFSISWDRSLDYFKKINIAFKNIYQLFVDADKLDLYRYFYAKTLTSIFYKICDTKLMNNEEKEIAFQELEWFFNHRKKLKTQPCQESLNIVLDRVSEKKYKEAVDICNIICEMRKYVPEDIRENMSKPQKIEYKEVE